MTRMICSTHHLNNSTFGCFLSHPKGCILNAVLSKILQIFKALPDSVWFFCYAGLINNLLPNCCRTHVPLFDTWPIAFTEEGRRCT